MLQDHRYGDSAYVYRAFNNLPVFAGTQCTHPPTASAQMARWS